MLDLEVELAPRLVDGDRRSAGRRTRTPRRRARATVRGAGGDPRRVVLEDLVGAAAPRRASGTRACARPDRRWRTRTSRAAPAARRTARTPARARRRASSSSCRIVAAGAGVLDRRLHVVAGLGPPAPVLLDRHAPDAFTHRLRVNTAQGADTYEVMAANDPGRRARFEALFAAHYRDVHRYALRRTEPALAEEVANEAFLVAWRRLEKVPREHPLPWLYAAAAHVLANQRRTETRHARRSRGRGGGAPAGRPRPGRPARRARRRPAGLRHARRARPRGAAADRVGAPQPRRRRARPPASPVPLSPCASRAPAAGWRRRCASATRRSTSTTSWSPLMPDMLTRLRDADPAHAHRDADRTRRRPPTCSSGSSPRRSAAPAPAPAAPRRRRGRRRGARRARVPGARRWLERRPRRPRLRRHRARGRGDPDRRRRWSPTARRTTTRSRARRRGSAATACTT